MMPKTTGKATWAERTSNIYEMTGVQAHLTKSADEHPNGVGASKYQRIGTGLFERVCSRASCPRRTADGLARHLSELRRLAPEKIDGAKGEQVRGNLEQVASDDVGE